MSTRRFVRGGGFVNVNHLSEKHRGHSPGCLGVTSLNLPGLDIPLDGLAGLRLCSDSPKHYKRRTHCTGTPRIPAEQSSWGRGSAPLVLKNKHGNPVMAGTLTVTVERI